MDEEGQVAADGAIYCDVAAKVVAPCSDGCGSEFAIMAMKREEAYGQVD